MFITNLIYLISGKNVSSSDELSRNQMSEIVKQLGNLEKKQNDKSNLKEIQQKARSDLDAEVKALKEQHSQSFKNHSAKMKNEMTTALKDASKINQVKFESFESQLNKEKLSMESLESKVEEIRSLNKDHTAKFKALASTDRVAKLEKNLDNLSAKIETELKNVQHSSENVMENKLKMLEQDKLKGLDKKVSEISDKIEARFQTDLQLVQEKLFGEITNVKSYANDQSKSLQNKFEKKMTKEIQIPFDNFTKELADFKNDLDKVVKYADKMEQETTNKITDSVMTRIGDLKSSLCENESKQLTLEKSFNDLNKSLESTKVRPFDLYFEGYFWNNYI